MTKARSDDNDPIETKEWLEALESLVKNEGKERAQYILKKLLEEAEQQGVESGLTQIVTPYANTISTEKQPAYPGDLAVEAALEAIIRWNAIAMVIKAKNNAGGVG